MAEKQYLLGSDEQQAWMRDYFFAPRGIGFTEPGTVGLDSAEFSAYNVAKSFYQNYPEVFNIAMIREKTDLAAEEIIKRLKRMYDRASHHVRHEPGSRPYMAGDCTIGWSS